MILFKTSFYKKYIEPVQLNISDIEYAYLAGIIDTDGSISFSRTGKSKHVPKYKVLVEVCNNNEELIEWLKQHIPRYNLRKLNNRIYVLSIYHIGVCWKLLPNIVERLVLKRKQAQFALKALELKYKFWRSENESYRTEIKKLHASLKWINRKGKHEDEEIQNTYYDKCPKNELYAYLAGVIDGDGSIYTNHKGVVQVSIGTKSEKYAQWLSEHIEGSFAWYHKSANIWMVSLKVDYFVYQLLNECVRYSVIKKQLMEKILENAK
jgi:intein/homing endonuclease